MRTFDKIIPKFVDPDESVKSNDSFVTWNVHCSLFVHYWILISSRIVYSSTCMPVGEHAWLTHELRRTLCLFAVHGKNRLQTSAGLK